MPLIREGFSASAVHLRQTISLDQGHHVQTSFLPKESSRQGDSADQEDVSRACENQASAKVGQSAGRKVSADQLGDWAFNADVDRRQQYSDQPHSLTGCGS